MIKGREGNVKIVGNWGLTVFTPQNHKKNIFDTLGRHPVHPFPARMAPGIALDALSKSRKRLRILDPMMGSGTVLAVARAKGHKAVGTDLDPLAVLLSKVWTTSIDKAKATSKARDVLKRAMILFRELAQADAYPTRSDEETRDFVRYWFDGYVRRQLAALSTVISRVQDSSIRNVLWCAFSRLIITKSTGASLAMDLAHSRPHREYKYAPIKPFKRFLSAVALVAANCPTKGRTSGPAVTASCGDARELNIDDCSIDLVLTSPPYLNAIDYMRCSKFSLVWMGYTTTQLRRIRGEGVGAEASCKEASASGVVREVIQGLRLSPKLPVRKEGVLSHYVWDMHQIMKETARVLKARGRAIYVVGDSTVRGTFIPNSSIVSVMAERHGLKLISRRSRRLPPNRRYMPPPRRKGSAGSMNARMRREVILVFRKSGSHRSLE